MQPKLQLDQINKQTNRVTARANAPAVSISIYIYIYILLPLGGDANFRLAPADANRLKPACC